MTRHLAFGLAATAVILWLTFFSGPGTVEVATLGATVVALAWFATVDPERLVDHDGRPHVVLFGLALVGGALLTSAASLLSSSTLLLTFALGTAAFVTGVVRAVRHGMTRPVPEE